METEEEKKEEEIEPVPVQEEFYAKNLFGETVNLDMSKKDEKEDLIGPKARENFNIFALTDAIGARKKRDAWVLYRKALASGMSPEEVFWKLFWQVKTMLLAQKTRTPAEADMKPFPYNKAKGFLRNFKSGELEKLSEEIVLGYHQVRRGKGEMETFVERMLLKL